MEGMTKRADGLLLMTSITTMGYRTSLRMPVKVVEMNL